MVLETAKTKIKANFIVWYGSAFCLVGGTFWLCPHLIERVKGSGSSFIMALSPFMRAVSYDLIAS